MTTLPNGLTHSTEVGNVALPTCSKTMSGGPPSFSSTALQKRRDSLKRAFSCVGGLAALAHHAVVLAAVDVADGAELLDQLALLLGGDDADGVGAGQRAQLGGEHAQAAGGAPDEDPVAGLQLAAVDQHPVGGEVGQPVGGRLLPGQVLGLGQQLLGLDLAELGERAPGRLIAPDLLGRGGQRVQAVDLGILVGGLVAVDDDLVAGLPAGDALADLPHDARRVRAADVMAPLGMIAVAPHADRLAQRRPHVVEVHAGRHHAHDHLERAGLGYLDLLQLERVYRLALALLADDPRGHRGRELARLGIDGCDLAEIDGHAAVTFLVGGADTRLGGPGSGWEVRIVPAGRPGRTTDVQPCSVRALTRSQALRLEHASCWSWPARGRCGSRPGGSRTAWRAGRRCRPGRRWRWCTCPA